MPIQDYFQFFDVLWHTNDETGQKVSIVITNEPHIIRSNYIILNEIPDAFYKVQISNMYEVSLNDNISSTSYFKVDYNMGIVYFHPDLEGHNITITQYSGRGLIKLYGERINITDENGYFQANNLNGILDELALNINNHKSSTSAHTSDSITNQSTVSGQKVSNALNTLQSEINNLVFTGSEHDALVTTSLVDVESVDFGSSGAGTYLNGRLNKWENETVKLKNANLVAEIQSRSYKVGDKIYSNLYGGSTWIVKSSVSIGFMSINFTDELHIVVNLSSGGTGIAECQISSIMDYIKALKTAKYLETFVKLKRRSAITIACLGDSITYGQNNDDIIGVDRNGQSTNFGDGSTYNTNKQDPNPFPSVLQSTLNTVFGDNIVTVVNRGYPGDRVDTGYVRHKNYSGNTMATMFYGVNDLLNATNLGVNADEIFNPTNLYCVQNFASDYRKFIVREILRGSDVILIAPFKWKSTTGFDGTYYSQAKIATHYRNAIFALGEELGLLVVDFEDFIGYYPLETMLSGVHPTHNGYNLLGKRLSSIFIGNGYKIAEKIYGERHITALPFCENMIWSGLNFDQYHGDLKRSITDTNSYQYAFPSTTESLDYGMYTGYGDLYYSFYAENDYSAVIPLCRIIGVLEVEMSLDMGLNQPEYKLDILTSQEVGDRSVPASSITLNTEKYYHTSSDCSPIIIQGRGWHTIKITCKSGTGTFIFMGFRFYTPLIP